MDVADDPAVLRMQLDEARRERDGLQARALVLRDERDVARSRVAELEPVMEAARLVLWAIDEHGYSGPALDRNADALRAALDAADGDR